MRVLFVSTHFPEDPSRNVSGGYQRMRMWLEAFQSLGADLEILFLTEMHVGTAPEDVATVTRRLHELWGIRCNVALCRRDPRSFDGLLGRYVLPTIRHSWQPALRGYAGGRQREALAGCLARSPDIVFFYGLHATGAQTASSLGGARVLLDLPDVEHRKFVRDVAQPPRRPWKPLRYLQAPAFWWGERSAIVRSQRAFVCSEADQRYLRRVMGVRNVEVIPNAVPRVDDGSLSAEPNVLFVGTYGYRPNVVAAEYLIRKVWPQLSQTCPEARLWIAGPRPESLPSFHEKPPGVAFLGFVADLDALYRKTRVFCCPIQSGGGTRIKILEAASHGVPVVSTPVGAEGLELEPDREIVLRSDASSLARACADLLGDRERARAIGIRARERVRSLYSRDAVVARMRSILTLEEHDR